MKLEAVEHENLIQMSLAKLSKMSAEVKVEVKLWPDHWRYEYALLNEEMEVGSMWKDEIIQTAMRDFTG